MIKLTKTGAGQYEYKHNGNVYNVSKDLRGYHANHWMLFMNGTPVATHCGFQLTSCKQAIARMTK